VRLVLARFTTGNATVSQGSRLTDAELRRRAMIAPRHVGGHSVVNPRIAKIISAADKIKGEPTNGQVRWLAYAYQETPETVRAIFATRKDRARARRKEFVYNKPHSNGIAWLPEEKDLLRQMWAARNGETMDELDARISSALMSLPVNEYRKVHRTPGGVRKKRNEILR